MADQPKKIVYLSHEDLWKEIREIKVTLGEAILLLKAVRKNQLKEE